MSAGETCVGHCRVSTFRRTNRGRLRASEFLVTDLILGGNGYVRPPPNITEIHSKGFIFIAYTDFIRVHRSNNNIIVSHANGTRYLYSSSTGNADASSSMFFPISSC